MQDSQPYGRIVRLIGIWVPYRDKSAHLPVGYVNPPGASWILARNVWRQKMASLFTHFGRMCSSLLEHFTSCSHRNVPESFKFTCQKVSNKRDKKKAERFKWKFDEEITVFVSRWCTVRAAICARRGKRAEWPHKWIHAPHFCRLRRGENVLTAARTQIDFIRLFPVNFSSENLAKKLVAFSPQKRKVPLIKHSTANKWKSVKKLNIWNSGCYFERIKFSLRYSLYFLSYFFFFLKKKKCLHWMEPHTCKWPIFWSNVTLQKLK